MTLRVVEHAERTDTGEVRSSNEDSYLVRAPLFVVADGMGGANAGEVASRAAVEEFAGGLPQGGDSGRRLAAAVLAANRRINAAASGNTARSGMGTTVTAALVGDGKVSIAHVGDSRAYLIRGDAIAQLTRDHTLVDELVQQGRLTEEEAARHPQRSIITRALGPEPEVEIDVVEQPLEVDDVLLLCSDGLTGMVGDERLLEIVAGARSLSAAAKELVAAANAAGGRDNITVLLARIGDHAPRFTSGMPARKPAIGGAAAEAAAGGSSRVRKSLVAALAVVGVVALITAAGWQASRAVFFLGTDGNGTVTVFKGLPYELPFGVDLYQQWYVSGVPASYMPADQRARLLDHKLRSKEDAADLAASLERGTLSR